MEIAVKLEAVVVHRLERGRDAHHAREQKGVACVRIAPFPLRPARARPPERLRHREHARAPQEGLREARLLGIHGALRRARNALGKVHRLEERARPRAGRDRYQRGGHVRVHAERLGGLVGVQVVDDKVHEG